MQSLNKTILGFLFLLGFLIPVFSYADTSQSNCHYYNASTSYCITAIETASDGYIVLSDHSAIVFHTSYYSSTGYLTSWVIPASGTFLSNAIPVTPTSYFTLRLDSSLGLSDGAYIFERGLSDTADVNLSFVYPPSVPFYVKGGLFYLTFAEISPVTDYTVDFALGIIIFLMFLFVSGMIFNFMTDKRSIEFNSSLK